MSVYPTRYPLLMVPSPLTITLVNVLLCFSTPRVVNIIDLLTNVVHPVLLTPSRIGMFLLSLSWTIPGLHIDSIPSSVLVGLTSRRHNPTVLVVITLLVPVLHPLVSTLVILPTLNIFCHAHPSLHAHPLLFIIHNRTSYTVTSMGKKG